MTKTRAPQSPSVPCDLTVLATSDLHLDLCAWDYFGDHARPGAGLAAPAERIAARRTAMPNCLLLDNGDLMQGNPLGDALAATRPPGPGRPHPMIQALNLLGYDAMALGNHDFDFGLEFLGAALAGAEFPVLAANLHRLDGGAPLFGDWTILQRMVTDREGGQHPLRIGVIGLMPPQVTLWSGAALAGRIGTSPMLDTARRLVPRMIAAGAEVVIALCHSGIGEPDPPAGPDAEDVALAVAAVPGVDAVIAGHSHELFPQPGAPPRPGVDPQLGQLAGKPACLPGHSARHLGMLRLTLQRDPAGRWRSQGGTGSLIDLRADPVPVPQSGGRLANAFETLCQRANTTTRRHLDRPAGHSAAPLTSFFSLASDCAATRMVARAMRWHVTRLLAEGPLADLPVLAAAAPGRAGGRGGPANFTTLPAGLLRERDLAALCPFTDTIRALRVTGATLAEWLEHSAGTFRQIPPGARDLPLVDPGRPFYNFDLIDGLTYRIDLQQPPRYDTLGRCIAPGHQRIRDLCHEGRPLDPAQEFILATTSFRAAGGGSYPGCGPDRQEVLARPTPVRAILGAYLAVNGPYVPASAADWCFVPMPGSTALLQTGPGAVHWLPRAGFEAAGLDPEGFLSLRLTL